MKKRLGIVATFLGLLGIANLHAETIVSDDFSDGDRTNNPAWYISGGGFNVIFDEANNNNTSFNQFFTTSFSQIDFDDQEGLRVTLSYRPEGANLTTVKVGLFDGVAPTADGWSQFNPDQPTRDWRGYLASIGIDGAAATEIRRNDNAIDDHAFFAGTTIDTAGTTINVAGSATFRVIRFELYRNGVDMVLEVYEGATVETLTSLGQATDAGAPFFGEFNNLALYQTTGDGSNGHIRYDNILLETFLNGSGVIEPVLSIMPAGAGSVMVTLSNLTVGLTCEVRSGPTTDLDTYTVVDSFPITNTVAAVTFPATNVIELIWGIVTDP